ncbi:MAG: hypothetical protein PF692_13440 [Kiritimatiellae bacterium]|jgi:hypothetical protein|nr:hypothetical protein [Kiritimatiellia bacterium]
MRDEIREELWEAKDNIAKECNYDIKKLFENLKDIQSSSNRKVVNLSRTRKHCVAEQSKPYEQD